MATITEDKFLGLKKAIALLPKGSVTFAYPHQVTLSESEWKFILDAALNKLNATQPQP